MSKFKENVGNSSHGQGPRDSNIPVYYENTGAAAFAVKNNALEDTVKVLTAERDYYCELAGAYKDALAGQVNHQPGLLGQAMSRIENIERVAPKDYSSRRKTALGTLSEALDRAQAAYLELKVI